MTKKVSSRFLNLILKVMIKINSYNSYYQGMNYLKNKSNSINRERIKEKIN